VSGFSRPNLKDNGNLFAFSHSLAGISSLVASYMYLKKVDAPQKVVQALGPVYNVVNNKYYVDEAYFGAIINPLIGASRNLWFYVDVNVIDKLTYKAADLTKGAGTIVKSLQNGNMQQYALYVIIGVIVTISYVMMR
jgi:NADH-quinone oxidoreductase subunit L